MKRYKKNRNVVLRHVEPSYFMVDVTKCYNNLHEKMFVTDEIGATIWKIHKDGNDLDAILSEFLKELNDDKTDEFISMVKKDVEEYIDKLVVEGIFEEV